MQPMRTGLFVLLPVVLGSHVARAGELDLNLGLQATHTQWNGDHGGGPTLGVSWFFKHWIGANFIGKEHYASVDDRFMSYFSLNAIVRHRFTDHVRLAATAGVVHQHEETQSAVDDMPVASAFGVADGIRHRMGVRTGAQLAFPVSQLTKGDLYVALDLDTTYFADQDRGPRWMLSAGLSFGVTRDFDRKAAK